VSDDLERLKAEYGRRAASPDDRRRYSLFNPAHLFAVQQRQRQTLQILRRRGLETLAGKRVLEVGCGRGGILHEYLGYGVAARDLVGIDLLEDRLTEARRGLPGVPLANCDARRLPFADATSTSCFNTPPSHRAGRRGKSGDGRRDAARTPPRRADPLV